ncbi:MAG: hypothetical protein ACD_26C00036G0004 [uncultured bacterium]|nr:MAG: hypothetical protein ACD_26C00036G0004 [uncultured bacterium]
MDWIDILIIIFSAMIGGWVSHFFIRKRSNRDFMIRNNYEIHKRLLTKLDEFFDEDVFVARDFDGFIKENRKNKKESKRKLKMSSEEFSKRLDGSEALWSCGLVLAHIQEPSKIFDLWSNDLKEVRMLSNSRIRRKADKIYRNYRITKQEEIFFMDNVLDECLFLEKEKPERANHYKKILITHYWRLFWLENVKDLKKLQKLLRKFVALK